MPQVAIDDTYRVVARYTRGNEEIVNVWHVQAPGQPFDATEMENLRVAFARFYKGLSSAAVGERGFINFIDSSVVFDRITIQNISSVPYSDPQEWIETLAGTAAGAQILPLQTSLCVSLRTGVATRRGRGRVFLGGFSEDASEEGADGFPRPTGALMTAVQNALTDLFDNVRAIDVGTDIGVASFVDLQTRAVSQARIKNVWSTQRRRTESVPITSTILSLNS